MGEVHDRASSFSLLVHDFWLGEGKAVHGFIVRLVYVFLSNKPSVERRRERGKEESTGGEGGGEDLGKCDFYYIIYVVILLCSSYFFVLKGVVEARWTDKRPFFFSSVYLFLCHLFVFTQDRRTQRKKNQRSTPYPFPPSLPPSLLPSASKS